MNYNPELPRSGFVTTHWVKSRYKISNSTLYSWIASHYLPPLMKVGPRAVRFRADQIREFEEKLLPRDVKPR